MINLTAVCARHGITVAHLGAGWYKAGSEATYSGAGKSPADAVCSLLKERYGIVTMFLTSTRGRRAGWNAVAERRKRWKDEFADSELAAVVALADRLLDVKEASRGES